MVFQIWDLAKCCAGAEGGLKLTLTGHIHSIRGLAVSSRHPYLFSAGEDKLVKCAAILQCFLICVAFTIVLPLLLIVLGWDLEYNKVIRHYHGHLSGVFCIGVHPVLDLLITGGRDSVARVWDMRTKHQIHVLGGHTNAISSLITSGADPQVITGSHDSTIKLWDLAAGRCMSTLTQHKKAIRSLTANPRVSRGAISAV
jgi:pleiotropic regulator 1